MLAHIQAVLTKEEVADFRRILESSEWVDGRVTAGHQSSQVKNNLQIPEDSEVGRTLSRRVVDALMRNTVFVASALPARIAPPLFNRYDVGMEYGAHVDGAMRTYHDPGATRADASTVHYRTDLSATLFLTEPDDYEGGDLVIETAYGTHAVKLPAGDLILYPATTRHRVVPITRGARWSSFMWMQSQVRDDAQRNMLFELDLAIQALGQKVDQNDPSMVALTGHYYNLTRMWSEV